jgi:threonine dehydratase
MRNDDTPATPDIHKEVLAAEERIRPHIRKTPLDHSPYLSRTGNCQVYLKLESVQHTGSFKFRGALNKFLSLSPREQKEPVITASSGNHGTAFAYLMNKFHGKGVVYLPENASPAKVAMIRQYGVNLEFFGNDCVMSENLAKKTAREKNQIFISPYNDLQIIGGQGTIGIELLSQFPEMDTVLVPVGGGGLISGIAGYLKAVDKKIEIIGCQPQNSPVMFESIKAGRILDMESKPTVADGTAGGIEPGSVTFDICRHHLDHFILVSEEEIKAAILLIINQHHMLIEGAAAVSVAAFLKEKERFKNRNVALIISGKKINPETLRDILNQGLSSNG